MITQNINSSYSYNDKTILLAIAAVHVARMSKVLFISQQKNYTGENVVSHKIL